MTKYYVLDKQYSNIIGILDKPETCNNSYIFYHIKSNMYNWLQVIGVDTPVGLERGVNAQWTNGGLIYSPPFN